ncbi:metal-binding protein [Methylomarinum sp. Ch1-1]|uniref:Metal-binding protein n=1 Tax=Methylomarinum roseum TaxID=3067653 RepID=A0AAU7NXG2_9GAMM|nr:metal-binding protein [Methylomarinum sp. Ch1-1]MDP4522261.1 metal-binding protein [Methylomarinum sp. Ch1-1]
MAENNEPCALCGEPVVITGFSLTDQNDEKHFCCEGCLCIYRLLNEDQLPSHPPEEKK